MIVIYLAMTLRLRQGNSAALLAMKRLRMSEKSSRDSHLLHGETKAGGDDLLLHALAQEMQYRRVYADREGWQGPGE